MLYSDIWSQLAAAAGVPEVAVWFFDGSGDISPAWWALMAAFKSGQTTADFMRVSLEQRQRQRQRQMHVAVNTTR
jgi:hypothetical protein